MRPDRLAARHATAREQLLRGEQHAGRAVAALQRIARLECGLQVGDLALIGHALDGLDARAVALHREHQTTAHDHAIDAHRTGAADAVLAADMAAGEAQVLAQEIDQSLARIDALEHLLAIDGQNDVVETLAHDRASNPAPMSSAATRLSRTPASCRLTALVACTSPGGLRSVARALTAASASPFASAASAPRARTGVVPTPKNTSRISASALPLARAVAASPAIA